MSYCSASRYELEFNVRYLTNRIEELKELGASTALLKEMARRLQAAQTALVTVGDCGD